ncbi:hypothetical protein LEP1GSC083_4878 [Leptospira interrogans serovar Pyrogenes str. L0374]|uniref:Uncharacterized protein n=3 Tax=Leptospira interrogans TaxID=173 RepID=M7AF71_LEPIR|nr:hypothetical protein G436_3097 [Leptospira interrogans serovar Hardjo str. Norma]EKO05834.1 hypothetical protein LEP1GSC077_0747 [Leptospira interrogans str. C10069]EKO98030.1 hypothetical protein LEP1GSC057_3409 [Leptospira interrogans str. Brem 329]EMN28168.1 hypothetical protein LEP1GSC083_4878 [Leptospira interrogans serovar Pyrogenes str. L0374]EMN61735.1 hypothetical protein LEP1GSC092_0806 [Leptospira interrogans serovar Pyrogenes str. R168]EMP09479.1 hypothetical protein LEP1GSC124_
MVCLVSRYEFPDFTFAERKAQIRFTGRIKFQIKFILIFL